ncbi:MAG: tail fiber domain-containing protein [Bacteroidales bacterium]|nr:tail fiber domain-containing protein [Bacteroidales bacterium]
MRTTKSFLMFIFIFVFAANIFAQKEKSTKSDPNVPIFEIKNDLGQTVFAVYPGGVKIFVDSKLKAAGGGFTVGSLSTGKAAGGDILSVSPGNVNIYIDTSSTLKAAGGGFTVGSLSTGKKALGIAENYLTVSPDSTRVYIDEKSTAGFAVGRIGTTVGIQNFMHLKKDNYFIGQKSGEKTTGLYNLFLGYESGFSNTNGTSNTFLGFQTGYSNTSGSRNIFIGDNCGYSNTSGNFNTFVGTNAGVKNTTGSFSTFLGYQAGREVQTIGYNTCIGYNSGAGGASGNNRAFLGYSSGASSTGDDNTYLGAEAGYYSAAGAGNVYIGTGAGRVGTGDNNIFIGKFSGYSAPGSNNILIGPGAGWSLQRSNILIIDNSSDTINPLIIGDFVNQKLRFGADVSVAQNLGINREAYTNASLGVDGANNGWGVYSTKGTSTGYNFFEGNLAIGTTSNVSSYELSVEGDGYFSGNLNVTGNVNAANFPAPSDIRFKKNIITINGALNKILSIRGVYYDWKVDEFKNRGFTKDKQIGVIAQEVEKVLPELVKTDDDGYKAVTYDKLTAVLIEAVKEQQKQIEALKLENQKLTQKTSEIDELRAELTELKKLVRDIAGQNLQDKTESAQ